MKKITKSLMTLALLVLGVTSANADTQLLFKAFDFSTMSSYPFYKHTDFANAATMADGGLKLVNAEAKTNNGDAELFIADWMIPDKGATYLVKITMKSTVAGTAELSMDPWGTGGTANITIAQSDDWTVAEATIANYPVQGHNNQYGGDTHIIFRCGTLAGTMIIQKVEVYQIIPDAPVASTGQNGWKDNILTNADFTGTEFSNYRAKDWISTESNGNITNPTIEDGAIKITNNQTRTAKIDAETNEQAKDQWGNLLWNEDAWNAQFWIQLPEKMAVGSKFLLKFKYKAANAGKASTQAHAQADGNGYKHYACIGDINFTTDWKTFEQEVTVASEWTNDFQSIAFNLNEDINPNVYYFKEISVQLPNIVTTVALTTGPSDWASFSWNTPVSLVNAEAGYAVELKGNGTYVELIPVTTVPANTAVIINAKEGLGIIELPIIDTADPIENNALQISDGNVSGADGDIYVLAKGTQGVGFYKLAATAKVPAGKAYLVVPGSSREFIGFAGEATAIKTVENQKKSGIIYNLAGQKVKNAKKGLYIIDGKKVIK